jgi:hypothetical protein
MTMLNRSITASALVLWLYAWKEHREEDRRKGLDARFVVDLLETTPGCLASTIP